MAQRNRRPACRPTTAPASTVRRPQCRRHVPRTRSRCATATAGEQRRSRPGVKDPSTVPTAVSAGRRVRSTPADSRQRTAGRSPRHRCPDPGRCACRFRRSVSTPDCLISDCRTTERWRCRRTARRSVGSPAGRRPGALGPAVIVGHVDWAGELGLFYYLKDLTSAGRHHRDPRGRHPGAIPGDIERGVPEGRIPDRRRLRQHRPRRSPVDHLRRRVRPAGPQLHGQHHRLRRPVSTLADGPARSTVIQPAQPAAVSAAETL